VALGKHGHEHFVDDRILAGDDAAQFLARLGKKLAGCGQGPRGFNLRFRSWFGGWFLNVSLVHLFLLAF
jgi:hypothetical protein